MNEIRVDGTDGELWISDIDAVRHTDSWDGIDRTVSVCQDLVDTDTATEHIPLRDGPDGDGKYGGLSSFAEFKHAAQLVYRSVVEREKNTVVYCHAAQCRSPAICAAIVMAVDGVRYDVAVGRIRDASGQVHIQKRYRRYANRFADQRA